MYAEDELNKIMENIADEPGVIKRKEDMVYQKALALISVKDVAINVKISKNEFEETKEDVVTIINKNWKYIEFNKNTAIYVVTELLKFCVQITDIKNNEVRDVFKYI